VARPELSEGVGCLVVVSEDMMKFETMKLFLMVSYLLMACRHAGVTTI
jgi:hypothetical protein